MNRKPVKISPILILLLYLPVHLSALPQDQEVFLDFEDAGVTPKNRIIYRERLSG